MYRKKLAIIFSLIFLSLITAPSIIVFFDDSIDTSIFYSLAEEEEEQSSKSKMETQFPLNNNDTLTGNYSQFRKFFKYQFKNYQIPHLNLISPPPDYIII